MSRYHFRKAFHNGYCLLPNDEDAAEFLARVKLGDCIAIEIVQQRNAERSALFWCMCGMVAENHETLASKDVVAQAVKILAGEFDAVRYHDEESGATGWVQVPRSLSFASMKEDDFQDFMSRAFRVIETTLLPGADIEELKRESILRSGYRAREKQTRR